MPASGIWTDARRYSVAAETCARNHRTDAAARARGGVGKRQRQKNALPARSVGLPPADVLLPDRNFASGSCGVRKGARPVGVGYVGGLRKTLPGRVAGGGGP